MADWMHVRYDPALDPAYLDEEEHQFLRRHLRAYQSRRLRSTHQDLAASARFGLLAAFFFSDIYGPHDFRMRNARFRQLYDKLVPLVGARPLETMREAIDLVELTDSLDDTLLEVLLRSGEASLPSVEAYERAYRQCDNYAARLEQIQRIGTTIYAVADLTRLPLIDLQLSVLRLPAQRLGWEPVRDFLVRGYRSLRHAGNVEPFVSAVTGREKARLDRIYGAGATQ